MGKKPKLIVITGFISLFLLIPFGLSKPSFGNSYPIIASYGDGYLQELSPNKYLMHLEGTHTRWVFNKVIWDQQVCLD